MVRRKFTKEFKFEAMKLVTDRGVAVAQAARDLDLAESVLRCRMRESAAAHVTAFSLTQDRDDLCFSVSACLHSNSPRSSCR
ncbi:MAG: transposase, partial [Roseovarius sp.]|nr:transposase [Roseovarius sp.]